MADHVAEEVVVKQMKLAKSERHGMKKKKEGLFPTADMKRGKASELCIVHVSVVRGEILIFICYRPWMCLVAVSGRVSLQRLDSGHAANLCLAIDSDQACQCSAGEILASTTDRHTPTCRRRRKSVPLESNQRKWLGG